MNKRAEILEFCRIHPGLTAKGKRYKETRLTAAWSCVDLFHEKTGFVETFNDWDEAHVWLLKVTTSGKPLPWAR